MQSFQKISPSKSEMKYHSKNLTLRSENEWQLIDFRISDSSDNWLTSEVRMSDNWLTSAWVTTDHRLLDCHGQAQLGGKKRLRPVPNQKYFWKIVFYHHSDLRQHVATSNGVWNKKEIALALIKKNAPRFQNPDSTTSVRVIILVKYKSSKCLFCTSRPNGSRSGGSSSRSSGSSSSSSSSSSNSSTIVR